MNLIKKILFWCLLVLFSVVGQAQDNNSQSNRTAEQEAIRQTEKLQQELGLSSEQVKLVFDINLKYERERLVSNTRRQAMERIKNKDADLQRILTEEQYSRLQAMRQQRTHTVSDDLNATENSTSRLRSTYRRTITNGTRTGTSPAPANTEKNSGTTPPAENQKNTESQKKQEPPVKSGRK